MNQRIVSIIELRSTWSAARHSDFESRDGNSAAWGGNQTFAGKALNFLAQETVDALSGGVMSAVTTGNAGRDKVPKNLSQKTEPAREGVELEQALLPSLQDEGASRSFR